MPNLNQVQLVGHLARDIEMRYTQSGVGIAGATLAVTRKWKDKQTQELKEDTAWVDITIFGKSAEFAVENGKKGALALCVGRLKTDKWEKDGQKFSKLCVVAEQFDVLRQKNAASEPAPASVQSVRAKSARPVSSDTAPDSEPDDVPF